MKRIKVFAVAACTASLILNAVSYGNDSLNPRIVEFSSDSEIELMSLANLAVTKPGDSGKFALYITGPTLFSGETKDKIETMYLYLPEDGTEVELDVTGDLLYVNGILQTVLTSSKTPRNFATWFEKADETAFQSLRIIDAQGKNSATFETNQFLKIVSSNPHVSTFFNPTGNEAAMAAFSNHKPLFWGVEDSKNKGPFSQKACERTDLSETRVLIVEDTINDQMLEILKQKEMPNLYRIFFESHPQANELLRVFPHIKAATILGKEKPNLKHLPQLKELNYLLDDEFDLGELPNPGKLLALTANIATNTTGLEKLRNLEYLHPFESEFSDEELSALLRNFPKLVYLNLTHTKLESLKPLKNAPLLEVVVIGELKADSEPDLSPLSELKHLRYISFHEDEVTEELIAKAEAASPEAEVFLYDHLCMGSGWLLIFLPVLAAVYIIKRTHAGARPGA